MYGFVVGLQVDEGSGAPGVLNDFLSISSMEYGAWSMVLWICSILM